MRGLYIHIPFCKSICNYCDFTKLVSSKENQEKYINRLLDEIDYYDNELKNIDTVYIGGGTPNSLPLNLLEKLLIKIKPILEKSIESSIELNPEFINKDLVNLLTKYKINRVSIGVESFNDTILESINRKHKKDDVINSIKLLKKNNINNINIDLIYGLPNQGFEDIKNDLNIFYTLNIPHISYYSLMLEDKTVFSYLMKQKKLKLPDDDLVADMYDYISNDLEKNSYKHYEISNYSKAGFESKHNLLYWNQDEYVGVGLGASGFINNYRYTNNKLLKNYFKEYIEEKEYIDLKTNKLEFMMLGLRKIDGININIYKEKYKSNIFDDFNFDKLINKKLLVIENDHIKIPKDKILLGNLIFEEFVGN